MSCIPIRLSHRLIAALLCTMLGLLGFSFSADKDRAERVNMFPRFRTGQVLADQISYHSEKNIKTESAMVVAMPDNSAKIDVNVLLRLEILGVQAQGGRAVIRARAKFDALDSDSPLNVPQVEPPAGQAQRQDSDTKFIEFTILPDGGLEQITGLDAFLPERQQAWHEWASRFLLAATFRDPSVRVAQKWNSEEAEKSSSPIAGLSWTRESTYVRDEPCRTMQLTGQGSLVPSDAEPENCAVILTNAALNQNSNAKNTTPGHFKLPELRTNGTPRGANRTPPPSPSR
jgi:hypothetical protein